MLEEVTTIQKETRLSIRTSEQDKEILTQAAQARHMNISQFVLQASLDAANAVLLDQTEFRLSPEEWKAFCDLLDAPPQNIEGLRRLLTTKAPWE